MLGGNVVRRQLPLQPVGFVPIWRQRLDDGRLDVRLLEAGHRFTRTRLTLSFLTGRLARSRLYHECDPVHLDIALTDSPTPVTRDGEVGPPTQEIRYGKQPKALVAYVAPRILGRRVRRSRPRS